METQKIQVKRGKIVWNPAQEDQGKNHSDKETHNIEGEVKDEKIKLYFGDEDKKKIYHKNFKNNRISTTK